MEKARTYRDIGSMTEMDKARALFIEAKEAESGRDYLVELTKTLLRVSNLNNSIAEETKKAEGRLYAPFESLGCLSNYKEETARLLSDWQDLRGKVTCLLSNWQELKKKEGTEGKQKIEDTRKTENIAAVDLERYSRTVWASINLGDFEVERIKEGLPKLCQVLENEGGQSDELKGVFIGK